LKERVMVHKRGPKKKKKQALRADQEEKKHRSGHSKGSAPVHYWYHGWGVKKGRCRKNARESQLENVGVKNFLSRRLPGRKIKGGPTASRRPTGGGKSRRGQ